MLHFPPLRAPWHARARRVGNFGEWARRVGKGIRGEWDLQRTINGHATVVQTQRSKPRGPYPSTQKNAACPVSDKASRVGPTGVGLGLDLGEINWGWISNSAAK